MALDATAQSADTLGCCDSLFIVCVFVVVNSWQKHVPAPESVPGRDFVRLNRSAVTKGAVSSKDVAAFRSTHDARLKNSASLTRGAAPQLDPSFTYGRPSKPSTPIHDVLTNSFQRNAIVEARRQAALTEARRAREEAARPGQFGSSQHTRASLGHMKLLAPPAKEPFKLEKFKQVTPRIGYQGLSTGAAAAAANQQQGQGQGQQQEQQNYDHYDNEQQQQQAYQSQQQQTQYGSSQQRFEEEKTQEGLRY